MSLNIATHLMAACIGGVISLTWVYFALKSRLKQHFIETYGEQTGLKIWKGEPIE